MSVKNNGCICEPRAYSLIAIAMGLLDSVMIDAQHGPEPHWGKDEWRHFANELSERLDEAEDRCEG